MRFEKNLIIMIILVVSTASFGKIIYVDDNGPANFNNIQAAIDDANDGDTVFVALGTYTGKGNRDINFKGKSITVRSNDPNDPAIVESTIIDCQSSGCGFIFENAEQADSILEGITIINGKDIYGGGIFASKSNPTIARCTIKYCKAEYGGGIFLSNSSATISRCMISNCSEVNPLFLIGGGICIFNGDPLITDCKISNNAVFSDGAGICCDEGSPTILNSIIENNQAGWGDGSGIYYSGSGKPSIINCTIRNNLAQPVENGGRTVRIGAASRGGSGGGIYIINGAKPIISQCSIIDNTAGLGGGLYIHDSSPFISRCTIEDNSAVGGGGIYLGCQVWSDIYTFRLEHCRISGNSSNLQAGGISTRLCNLAMSNCVVSGNRLLYGGGGSGLNIGPFTIAEIEQCTIVGNSSVGYENSFAGGLYLMMCDTKITNSIINQNRAAKGAQITINAWNGVQFPNEPPINEPTLITLHHNDFADEQDRELYVFGETNGLTLEKHNNMNIDPLFANPGYWDPNGTLDDPNDDFWIEGDYHLKSQAGRWDPNSQTWLQDDATSPCIDKGDPNSLIGLEPFPNGGYINMGAYGGTAEASKSYFGKSVCETIVAGDINGDCKVDETDLEILMLHWLVEY